MTRQERLAALRGDVPEYQETFDDDADFVAAVVAAHGDGVEKADNRLQFQAAATGLNEGVPSEGAFLVPEATAAEWWNHALEVGQLLSRVRRIPITNTDGLKLPAVDETSRADGSRYGGISMSWVEEAETATATKPQFREMELVPRKLLGIAYASGELMNDAPAMAAWLRQAFAEEAAFAIEDQILNGTGAGQPLGILSSAALLSVAKESGQAGATLLAANCEAMMARLWAPSRRNSVWIMNPDALAQVEGVTQTNGGPLVTYEGGAPRILGRPVISDEYTATLGSQGDVILMDPTQYLLGERDADLISSIHVRFLWDEQVFRIRFRVDGQPGWASPITPHNSSTTRSAFVTLAERS